MILVSQPPQLYRHARDLSHECGPYQLRAALNMFGKDAEPEDLYYSHAHRQRDWSLPWLMPGILARHGIRASWRFWPRARFTERKLTMLALDRPVLYVVNSILGSGRLHWISSWGHDPATDEFLVYDSQAPEASGTHGNTRYSTELLLSRLPWRGTFALTIEGENH